MARRKNYSATFMAKVALAALADERTMAELSADYGIHQNLVSKWKKQLQDSATAVFSGEIKSQDTKQEKELHELHAKFPSMFLISAGKSILSSLNIKKFCLKAGRRILS